MEASRLGVTLPHEHICVSSPGFWQAWPEYFGGRANFVTTVAGKLKAAKDEGVDTIVDVTPFDVGRDVRLLQELSEKSGMQIITCTGHWLAPSLSMEARTVEELTDFFVLEIERGIDGTEIKPGVIKVATDAGLRAPHPLYHEGVTRFLEMALRAAARASIATGVPVTTHTTTVDRTGEKQAEIFESEGLNPAMVCLGHCDDTDDMAYLEGLVKRGYTIGMDHMTWGVDGAAGPGPAALSWQRRAQSVKRLLDDGFGNKIFLSNDWYFGISMAPTGFMKTKEQTNPDGILFSHRKVLPYLKQIGVSDQQIRMITVQNPRRFFGGLSI
ncbi:MAG TPA: hypothetical protein VGF06_09270 [Terriglobales bacterium]